MSIYYGRDIETSVDGDLVVNERGDIELAESYEASEQLLKTIIATDIGEFSSIPSFGANIGSLIGTDAATAIERVPILIREGIRRSDYIDGGDIFIDVYPIDIDKIIIFIEMGGTFIDSGGQEVVSPTGTLKFYFPFTAERIREWT